MKLFHPLLALIASATDSELVRQLRYLADEYLDCYNRERAHSALAFWPPARDDLPPENTDASLEGIVCQERLGGLVKYYERRAA